MSNTNGRPEVWLSVATYTELMATLKEFATDDDAKDTTSNLLKQSIATAKFCVDNKVVKSWDFTDREGKALDPQKVEDYELLNLADFVVLSKALINPAGDIPKD